MLLRGFAFALVLAAVAAACGSTAGGRSPREEGPAPGEFEPVTVEGPFGTFELRSAVLGQYWHGSQVPGAWTLSLRELPGGCGTDGTVELGGGSHVLGVGMGWPAWGRCRMGETCEVRVTLRPDPPPDWIVPFVETRDATLRIDAWDGRDLLGELTATFVRDPEEAWGSSEEGTVLCAGYDGRFRRREVPAGGGDPCNDGKPTVELVLPFRATFCPEAVRCEGLPCPPAEATGCEPLGRAVDCDRACAGLGRICAALVECQAPVDCERLVRDACDFGDRNCRESCPVASRDPVFDRAFGCLETADSPAGWDACMTGCGGDR